MFSGSDGYPFKMGGIVYYLVKVYQSLKSKKRYSKYSNMLSPEDFSSELIRTSYYLHSDTPRVFPATWLMYQQYNEQGFFVDCAYTYICDFKKNSDNSNINMTLTVKTHDTETNKTMEEWNGVCEIAYSIAVAEDPKAIVMDDHIPCRQCLVRTTCILKKYDNELYEMGPCGNLLYAKEPCDKLEEYKKIQKRALRKKLPEWSLSIISED